MRSDTNEWKDEFICDENSYITEWSVLYQPDKWGDNKGE